MDEVLHTTDGLYSQVAELTQGARLQPIPLPSLPLSKLILIISQ